ncbi:MAG TPA: c-type cytochrome domain-containing protein [Pirellulales bacterium]|jgi:WD40 repeat protein
MQAIRTLSVILILLVAAVSSVRADEPAAQTATPVSFTKDVAPILVQKCQACHGPADPKGDFQTTTFELLGKAGASASAPITAGKPDESELLRLIASEDTGERMPKDGDPLSAEQVATVRRWIEEGAKFDSPDPKALLASIVPRLPHPAPPETYRVPVPVTALAFRPDGQELAASGYREITIWNPATGALLRRIKDVPQRTLGLAYSPDGSLLAAAGGLPGQSGEVTLYDPATGKSVRQLGSMSDVAWGVAFNPAGNKLAACGADRSIRIYDVATGKEDRVIEDHADWVMAIAWNHDGSRLASASRDKTSKLFDAATGESLVTYPGHGEQVFGVAFNADSSQVLSSGRDKKIHIWKSADAGKIAEITGFGQEVYDVTVQAGQIFCCSADKTARQFEAGERKAVRNYEGHVDWVYSLTYNDSTKRLATGSFDGEVRVWNTADGALITAFKAAPGYAPAATQPVAQQAAAK